MYVDNFCNGSLREHLNRSPTSAADSQPCHSDAVICQLHLVYLMSRTCHPYGEQAANVLSAMGSARTPNQADVRQRAVVVCFSAESCSVHEA